MAYPVKSVTVTCPFRYVSARRPSPWAAGYHPGIDFKAFPLTPIYAPADSKIIHSGSSGWGGAYGRQVIGECKGTDGKTYRWIAAHNTTLKVKTGDRVKLGDRIALSGATGNTFGPHCHFEVRKAPFGYYDHVNPAVVLNIKATAPAKPVDPWFDGLAWNLAGFDSVKGKANWDSRISKVVAAIKHYDRDVLHLLEVPNGKAADLTKRLDRIGYKFAVRTDGRCILVRKTIKVGRTNQVTLKERGPANDTKQIVLAEVWPSESPNAVILETGHLEYRDGAKYDKARVTQGKQAKTATLAFARACKVPYDRVVSYNDENSGIQVSDQAYGKTFPDLAERDAYVTPQVSTLIGWDGRVRMNGYRPDKVHVHKDRPARGGTSVTFADDKLSDHLPVIYTIGRR